MSEGTILFCGFDHEQEFAKIRAELAKARAELKIAEQQAVGRWAEFAEKGELVERAERAEGLAEGYRAALEETAAALRIAASWMPSGAAQAGVEETAERAENTRLRAACNICGKPWPNHIDACAYVATRRDLDAEQAGVVGLREALTASTEAMIEAAWFIERAGFPLAPVRAALDRLAQENQRVLGLAEPEGERA